MNLRSIKPGTLVEIDWFDANTEIIVRGQEYRPEMKLTWVGYLVAIRRAYLILTPQRGGNRTELYAVPKNTISAVRLPR